MVLVPMCRAGVVLLLAAAVISRPSISIEEWTTLRQFFNDTGGAAGTWHNATGWNVSNYDNAPDPCDGTSWFGITDRFYHGMSFGRRVDTCTNATPGRRQVQQLDLFAHQPTFNTYGKVYDGLGNGLQGHLGALGRLHALVVLNIVGNAMLGGAIPDLANCTALRTLSLFNNGLEGTIPSSLFGLTSLFGLWLFGNQLTGTIPAAVSSCTQLEYFSAYQNRLSGTIPSLRRLTTLKHLGLSYNELEGTLPSVAGLTQLQSLMLEANRFTGVIPTDMRSCTRLTWLTIQKNFLTGTIPDLARLTKLRRFKANHNMLNGTIPSLNNCTALAQVDLAANRLSGTIPVLARLTALKILVLQGNAISGTIPSLDSCVELQTVDLNSNRLVGTIPSLSKLSALTQLELQNNELVGTVPGLESCTALEQLWLFNNSLSSTLPPLVQLTALRQLLLHDNQLRGAVPPLPRGVIAGRPVPGDDDRPYGGSRHWPVNTDPSLTLFNNQLSCALPSGNTAPGAGLVAVVAFGNRFSSPAPQWVRKETRDATFLFVPEFAPWRWIVAYLGGGGALLGIVACSVMQRQQQARRGRGGSGDVTCGDGAGGGAGSGGIVGGVDPGRCAKDARAAVLLARDGAAALAVLSIPALAALVPAYWSSAGFFQCGNPLMHTSLAYMDVDGARGAAPTAAAVVCLFVWLSALCCYRLWMARMTDNDAAGPWMWHSASVVLLSSAQTFIALLMWLLAMVLLSVPTMLYVMSLYLPSDNVMGIGATGAALLRRGVPFLLALVNSVLLPLLTRRLAWRIVRLQTVAAMRVSRERVEALVSMLVTRLLLLARLVTMVVIPVGAVLVLAEGCGGRWKLLWFVCAAGTNTTVSFSDELGCRPSQSIGCDYYVPSSGGGLGCEPFCIYPDGDPADVANVAAASPYASPALTAEQLCDNSGSSSSAGRCVRGVIEALAPLFAEKLAIAACLQPALLLLLFRKRILTSRAWGLDLEFAATLAQIEVALFYGIALPVIIPIAAIALATHWLAMWWLLRQQGIIVLTCARPPVSYLLVSLVLQAVLATWFFGATQGAGYGWAVGVLSFAAVASTLHGILRQPQPKPGPGNPLPWLLSNERGVRLTTLESGPGNGRAAGACHYKLMAE